MTSRINKIEEVRDRVKVDAFLLSSPHTLKHLTGYFFNFEVGPSPFHLLPAALFISPDQAFTMLMADSEAAPSSFNDNKISVKFYASYVYESPLDFTIQFINQLGEVLKESGIKGGRFGIEANSLPESVTSYIKLKYPDIELVDVSVEVSYLRLIKDMDEVNSIRVAAGICDIGQVAALRNIKEGISEIDLFNTVRREMEIAAGGRIPVLADFISGETTVLCGGNPTNKVIQYGDLLISDLVPCVNGYWGDSCNTIVAGNPTPAQKKSFTLVREALEIGINAIRPGISASSVDKLMREHISKSGSYPHHSGHGIGTQYHEEPRIVPYNSMKLEAGMVIALEPGIYIDKYGIRLEHSVLVASSGCELLTKFNHTLM